MENKYFSGIKVLIVYIIIGTIFLAYQYLQIPNEEAENVIEDVEETENLRENNIKEEEEEEEEEDEVVVLKKNELNDEKPVGNLLLTVTGIRKVLNAAAKPYLNKVTTKDVIVLDLLFKGGSNCTKGCFFSNTINDYKLTTLDGALLELGEYSTKFESAPFLDHKFVGLQSLSPGESGERQAYFFVDSGDNEFIFTYHDPSSGQDQSYRLKIEKEEQIIREEKKETLYVRLVSPNGGEYLCLGEDFIIRWESDNLRTVDLWIKQAGGQSARYPLGSFPADFNESGKSGTGLTVWKVGDTTGGIKLKEGNTYEILINGYSDKPAVNDVSDGVFSILLCQG